MSKRKLTSICLFLFILSISIVHAQLEEQIDLLLEEENASFGKAAYLVLVASEQYEESETLTGALELLKSKNWDINLKGENEAITLGEYSYLLMKAFNIPGGIMYMIIPGPRYAVRELAYHRLIIENPDPTRMISGEEVMTLLTRVINWKEGE